MSGEWLAWHREYDRDPHRARRLQVVQAAIRAGLDRAPAGPIRVLSLCAGDGRDLFGVLADHPRAPDVRARLVEIAPELVRVGRARSARLGLPDVECVVGDAGDLRSASGAVPADLLLLCGIFGNLSDADVENTVRRSPTLCAAGATVVWTRGRYAPDLTPSIRAWFRTVGFEELAFVVDPDSPATVGSHRLVGPAAPFRATPRLFTFLPADERPAGRAAVGARH